MRSIDPRVAILIFICSIPLLFSLPTLGDPYGPTEEGVNNAIWALGGQNIVRHGAWLAKFGAVVTPYPRAGGIYAHHPPLATWISAVLQLLTRWEGAPRLVALLLVGLSLATLFLILGRYVSDQTAMLSIAVTAFSPWLLIYSRMLTTVTLATPFFVFLLGSVLQRLHHDRPWGFGTLFTIAGLVLSSWDGVISGALLVTLLSGIEIRDAYRKREKIAGWLRALLPAATYLLFAALLFAYLIMVNRGASEMREAAHYRFGFDEFPLRAWIRKEVVNTANGLGWLTIVLIALAPLACRQLPAGRQLFVAMLCGAALGLPMVIIFRNGAMNHEFWGYNLFLPAAFTLAAVIERVRTGFPISVKVGLFFVLAAQALIATRLSAPQLERDHELNRLGTFLKRNFGTPNQTVKMFWEYDFHPYIEWHLNVVHEVSASPEDLRRSLQSGQWKPDDPVLVENAFATKMNCIGFSAHKQSPNLLWSITSAGELEKSCRRP